MSDLFQALKLFVRTAQTGNFSRAGRDLGISQPTASRIIANLEEELGATLFTRNTRAVSLTDAGIDYLARVAPILDALDEAAHALSRSTELRGALRIGLSSSFAEKEVIPHLPAFMDQHPKLRVELLISDQRQDLVVDGVDVALRLGPMPDSAALARRLGAWDRVTAAAPAYLARMGVPETPADLVSHRLITGPVGVSARWSFKRGDRVVSVKVDGRLSVTLNSGAIAAAIAGLGIVATGMSSGQAEFASGALIQVLPDWKLEPIEVHAVYAMGGAAKPAARVFTEYLLEAFRDHR